MKKAIIPSLAFLLFLQTVAQPTAGKLKGTVTDKATGESLPFANIIVTDSVGTILYGAATSDFDGNFTITPLNTGSYFVRTTFVGYNEMIISNVIISSMKTTYLTIEMTPGSIQLESVDCISFDKRSSKKQRYTADKIEKLPVRSISELQSVSSGVVAGSVRGTRSGSSLVYIDGIKVRGSKKTPRNAIQEVENDESYAEIVENKFSNVSSSPVSTFSIDVDAASYSNVRRMIRDGQLPPKDAVRTEEFINYFNYGYPDPEDEEPFSINTEIGPCAWNENNLLVHIGLQSKKIDLENLSPSHITFLLDVSGSMGDENKLPLVKKSLRLLVNQLRPKDRVAIVVYAGSSGIVLKSTSGDKKQKIMDAIDNLRAGGSTAGGSGINLAYSVAESNLMKNGNNRVVLATDGDFNVGISDDAKLVKLIEEKRDKGIYLTVLGFGMGNLKDSKLEKLADNGNGNYAYIDDLLEAKKIMVNELGANLMTIAKDVKLQVEFNPAKVSAYRLVGYENRMLSREDFNDDTKDAGEMGAGHSVTALYEIVPVNSKSNIDQPDVDDLKYQEMKLTTTAAEGNEALTVKVRYKKPDERKSKLFVRTVDYEEKVLDSTSLDFKFLTSVAQFGMLLTGSKYLGSATFSNTVELAQHSKGQDMEGYRSEFVELVKLCEKLR